MTMKDNDQRRRFRDLYLQVNRLPLWQEEVLRRPVWQWILWLLVTASPYVLLYMM